MPRNIEIKARLASIEAILPIAVALCGQQPQLIEQDDTFFHCDNGRLKLRAFSAAAGELIFYRRADRAGPKESFYVRSATDAPDSLREALSLAYGEVGRVRKRRWLLMAGRTRIHLDAVQGLGEFLELEVVLRDGEAAEDGVAEAQALMARLGIAAPQLIEGAYVDLLKSSRASAA